MLQRILEKDYRQLNKRETSSVLAAINPSIDIADFEAETCVIYAQKLDFYPGYQLLDMNSRNSDPAKRIFVIYYDDHHFEVLDWSNAPIYRLNDNASVQLDEDNIHDYVRLFFAMVRGRKGRFHIIESVEDLDWKDDPPPSTRKAISNMLMPLTLIQVNHSRDGEAFHLRAVFNHRDMLFQSDIHVTIYGRVRMDSEDILIENLPVFDENLGQ